MATLDMNCASVQMTSGVTDFHRFTIILHPVSVANWHHTEGYYNDASVDSQI